MLGISGALACFILFKSTIGKLQPTALLEKLARMGGATLGIYVVQAILLEYLLPRYISFATLPMPVIIMLMPLAMLMITYFIVQLFNRSELLGFMMFGRAYKK